MVSFDLVGLPKNNYYTLNYKLFRIDGDLFLLTDATQNC